MFTASSLFYTLSLHDALPIFPVEHVWIRFRYLDRLAARDDARHALRERGGLLGRRRLHFLKVLVVVHTDRKSTRLNSSHRCISYAVFCLKKKKTIQEFIILSN